MRALALALVLAVLTPCVALPAGGGALDVAKLQELGAARRCERVRPGHVIYAGDSSNLRGCLEKLGEREIAELRITSGGGDAWKTLETARAWIGRVDLLVIDGLCASSCANYLLPMAKRVRVPPQSYVLVHGSLTRDFPPEQWEELRSSLTGQLREQNAKQPGKITEQEIASKVNGALATFRADLARQVPVQEEFARTTLRCHDWLDPNRHLPTPIPDQYRYLLVTPVMAYRCLQITRIDGWWPPDAQKDLDPRLQLMRARR
jgi:hypothetical protein